MQKLSHLKQLRGISYTYNMFILSGQWDLLNELENQN